MRLRYSKVQRQKNLTIWNHIFTPSIGRAKMHSGKTVFLPSWWILCQNTSSISVSIAIRATTGSESAPVVSTFFIWVLLKHWALHCLKRTWSKNNLKAKTQSESCPTRISYHCGILYRTAGEYRIHLIQISII